MPMEWHNNHQEELNERKDQSFKFHQKKTRKY